MRRKNKNIVLENIKLISAGAKGVAVGKTDEGKTVLVSGAVPGDLVNVRVVSYTHLDVYKRQEMNQT